MNIVLVSVTEGCYNKQISILQSQSKSIASEESIKKQKWINFLQNNHYQKYKMKIENKLIKKKLCKIDLHFFTIKIIWKDTRNFVIVIPFVCILFLFLLLLNIFCIVIEFRTCWNWIDWRLELLTIPVE